jgi:hypothetical protein
MTRLTRRTLFASLAAVFARRHVACPHGDKTCPCPDGDMCHYEGPGAWMPTGTPVGHVIHIRRPMRYMVAAGSNRLILC